jgi:pimeloyl-ACP methyl ester carboxylesterase
MIHHFTIQVPDAVLDDLQARLGATRWVDDFANDDWRYGANVAYLRGLVEYWRRDYDWRARERLMNELPHFKTEIGGVPLHFIRAPGKGPRAIPLMLNHGWPWTFWDLRKLIGPLSDPAAHGGNALDAFDVIVPSLPGYGFSTPLLKPGIHCWKTADLWVKLMADLGYPRFAVQGADWGAIIAAQLGHKYPERLIGLHIQTLVPLDFLSGGHVEAADFEPDDIHRLRANAAFFKEELGYLSLQTTKPQTPTIALNDSPAGLLAWIVEKRRGWSDCHGDVESRFSKDELLDVVMLYWVTQSFGTSARYYYEAVHEAWAPSHAEMPCVRAPTAIVDFPKELVRYPRKWAQRYYNLQRWTTMQAGGHFGPVEEPEAVIQDLRAFFRDKR